MRKIYLFFYLFLVSYSSISQYNYLFVIENKNGDRLPYASISWGRSNGVSANEHGIVKFSSSNLIDTIYASNIGYSVSTTTIENLEKVNDTLRILLEFDQPFLPPITLFSKEKNVVVGITDPETSFISNRYRNVLAAVEIQQPGETCKIKSISVFIHKKSQQQVPFRIRVFDKNQQGFPDKDLLRENVICTKYQLNQWNEINLSDNNILTSDKHFFIAIEWLNIPELNDNNDLQIGLTNKESRQITLFKLSNKPWKKFGLGDGKFDNIMLKAILIH